MKDTRKRCRTYSDEARTHDNKADYLKMFEHTAIWCLKSKMLQYDRAAGPPVDCALIL